MMETSTNGGTDEEEEEEREEEEDEELLLDDDELELDEDELLDELEEDDDDEEEELVELLELDDPGNTCLFLKSTAAHVEPPSTWIIPFCGVTESRVHVGGTSSITVWIPGVTSLNLARPSLML